MSGTQDAGVTKSLPSFPLFPGFLGFQAFLHAKIPEKPGTKCIHIYIIIQYTYTLKAWKVQKAKNYTIMGFQGFHEKINWNELLWTLPAIAPKMI